MNILSAYVRKVITICVERLLHSELKIILHFASMLLHFALLLHFAAILITFCGDYYILRRNRARFSSLPVGRDEKYMLPPSFPYPSPPRTQGPVQSCQSWWRLVSAAITQLKVSCECGWIFSLKTAQTRKERRDEHLALPWPVCCR